ncbi:uncharacterized protein LOC110008208 [Amborella trichopoda]|uniref:uncharacterized protein LOC110008208 n=1 Tax=Amborella trichopoda TaxID=13333 RepID=UPI0009C11800|nr:uncharacterized protein LOC110008208 [Amborella trichopoda]|eukprot:XP_020529877.1 uncharacterized protein LOC110008208 [Amborella trichopoda]
MWVYASLPLMVVPNLLLSLPLTIFYFLYQGFQDELVWDSECGDIFSIRSTYNLLCHDRIRWNRGSMRKLWSWRILQKVKVFLWVLFQGKCLTVDNLIKRGTLHTCEINEAEFRAAKMGVSRHAQSQRKIIIGGHSAYTVLWCAQPSRVPWRLSVIMEEILLRIEDKECVFVHVYRSANSNADLLAKLTTG